MRVVFFIWLFFFSKFSFFQSLFLSCMLFFLLALFFHLFFFHLTFFHILFFHVLFFIRFFHALFFHGCSFFLCTGQQKCLIFTSLGAKIPHFCLFKRLSSRCFSPLPHQILSPQIYQYLKHSTPLYIYT